MDRTEFLAILNERFSEANTRYEKLEKALDEAERVYVYWEKVVKAFKVVIVHEEWLEQQAKGQEISSDV